MASFFYEIKQAAKLRKLMKKCDNDKELAYWPDIVNYIKGEYRCVIAMEKYDANFDILKKIMIAITIYSDVRWINGYYLPVAALCCFPSLLYILDTIKYEETDFQKIIKELYKYFGANQRYLLCQ